MRRGIPIRSMKQIMVELTSVGTLNWTCPDRVTQITGLVIGSGGGAQGSALFSRGSPGGGGGERRYGPLAVVPNTLYVLTVGSIGVGSAYGSAAGSATNGGDCSIGSLMIAKGGFASTALNAPGSGGTGGTGGTGTDGSPGQLSPGTTSGTAGGPGGAGGAPEGGPGGAGGVSGDPHGKAGTAPGGGGGGGQGSGGNGGNGAPGLVRLWYWI